ncbi:MAG: helix-turn-helix transcriptional regulator [Pseudomonadota bacterium]
MANPVDLHVGQRLRQRRSLLGMTQQKLALAVGIKFQQIQKYESGANRVSASRLFALAQALDVPVSYFFEGAASASGQTPRITGADSGLAPEVMHERETIDLVRAYYQLHEGPRRRILDLVKTLAEGDHALSQAS